MTGHACLLAARFAAPAPRTDSQPSNPCQSYEIAGSAVTRAWGRVASSCRGMAYRFVVLALFAALMAAL